MLSCTPVTKRDRLRIKVSWIQSIDAEAHVKQNTELNYGSDWDWIAKARALQLLRD